jgi:hypothetical protein
MAGRTAVRAGHPESPPTSMQRTRRITLKRKPCLSQKSWVAGLRCRAPGHDELLIRMEHARRQRTPPIQGTGHPYPRLTPNKFAPSSAPAACVMSAQARFAPASLAPERLAFTSRARVCSELGASTRQPQAIRHRHFSFGTGRTTEESPQPSLTEGNPSVRNSLTVVSQPTPTLTLFQSPQSVKIGHAQRLDK